MCGAYFLAKRGARVTVLERDQVGKAASFGNAGSIAPGHPPINKPGRVVQALQSLFRPLSPLYVAPDSIRRSRRGSGLFAECAPRSTSNT